MRKKSLILGMCMLGAVTSLTACKGEDEAVETTQAVVQETKAVKKEEVVEQTEPQKQQITVMINIGEEEEEEEVDLPFDEFNKYGKVVKTKEGYRVLSKDGTYVTEALLNFDGHCYYFDETGYLKNDVFVPAQNSKGELITLYVHNYSYVYGLIKTPDGAIYYIDEDLGRFEKTTKEIDGQMYYFDEDGKSISEKTFNKKYVSNSPVEETTVELKAVGGDFSALNIGGVDIYFGQTLTADLDAQFAESGVEFANESGVYTSIYSNLTAYGYELAENIGIIYALKADVGTHSLPEEFMNMSEDDWSSKLGEAVKTEETEDGEKSVYWESDLECVNVKFKDGAVTEVGILNKEALNNLLTIKGFSSESVIELSNHLVKYFMDEEVIDYYIVALSTATVATEGEEAVEETEETVEETEAN